MVRVSTVVVRSGTASARDTAFCTPSPRPRSTTSAKRTPPVNGWPEAPVTISAARTQAVSTRSAYSSIRPRWVRVRCTIRPPSSAPTANAASATSDAASENPGAPAMAKPEKTTLPVMFATNTRPSSR